MCQVAKNFCMLSQLIAWPTQQVPILQCIVLKSFLVNFAHTKKFTLTQPTLRAHEITHAAQARTHTRTSTHKYAHILAHVFACTCTNTHTLKRSHINTHAPTHANKCCHLKIVILLTISFLLFSSTYQQKVKHTMDYCGGCWRRHSSGRNYRTHCGYYVAGMCN